jgi:cell division protein FtsL
MFTVKHGQTFKRVARVFFKEWNSEWLCMNARTGDIGSLVFGRSGHNSFRRVVFALLMVGGLLLYVGGKVTIVQLGYKIEALEREKHDLERENRSLQIEASSLSSPARIEEIAIKRLGMVRPANENIVIVKRKRDEANAKIQTPQDN